MEILSGSDIHPYSLASSSPAIPSNRIRPRLGIFVNRNPTPNDRVYPSPSISRRETKTKTKHPEQILPNQPDKSTPTVDNRTKSIAQGRILDWPQLRLRRSASATRTTDPRQIQLCKIRIQRSRGNNCMTTKPIKALHSIEAVETCINKWDKASQQNKIKVNVLDHEQDLPNARCPASNQRRGIATNPNVRRRYSADGLPLNRTDDCNFQDKTATYSALKRSYPVATIIDQSAHTKSRNSDTPIPPSIESGMPMKFHPTTASEDSLDSLFLLNKNNNNSKSDIPTKRKRYSGMLRSKMTGRMSSGSLQFAQSNHSPTRLNLNKSNRHNSDLFTEIRRSARHTLNSICRVLKSSTTNLSSTNDKTQMNLTSSNLKSTEPKHSMLPSPVYNMGHQSHVPTPYQERIVDRKLWMRFDQTVEDSGQNTNYCIRTVELSRPNLQYPFGVFVTKSGRGFRITRLTNDFEGIIQVGDEILQVNNSKCDDLSLADLIQLLSHTQTIQLKLVSDSC